MNDEELNLLLASMVQQLHGTQVWCGPLFVGGNPHENGIEETKWRTEAICRN